MRKVVLFMLVVTLFSAISLAFAEGFSDLDSWTVDDILAAKQILNEELAKRGYEESSDFYPGTYVCGKDIDSGSYDLQFIDMENGATISIFLTEEDYTNDKILEKDGIYEGSSGYHLDLSDGMVVKIKMLGSGSIKIKQQ